jgi:hypothetical protein
MIPPRPQTFHTHFGTAHTARLAGATSGGRVGADVFVQADDVAWQGLENQCPCHRHHARHVVHVDRTGLCSAMFDYRANYSPCLVKTPNCQIPSLPPFTAQPGSVLIGRSMRPRAKLERAAPAFASVMGFEAGHHCPPAAVRLFALLSDEAGSRISGVYQLESCSTSAHGAQELAPASERQIRSSSQSRLSDVGDRAGQIDASVAQL